MTTEASPSSKPRRRWLRWCVFVIGVCPNVVLLGSGVLSLFMAFGSSFIYALGNPAGLFQWVVVAIGMGSLNLFALRDRALQSQQFLRWLAVLGSSGMLLWSINIWKSAFQGSLAPTFYSAFPGTIAASSLVALVLHHFATQARPIFTHRQLAGTTAFLCVLLGFAVWIVSPPGGREYEIEQKVARHLNSLGGSAGWSDWTVTQANLRASSVKDDDLQILSELRELRSLDLADTTITDAGMDHLAGLTDLRALYLDNLPITDAGLSRIEGVTQMRYLTLNNTQITDAGLVHLRNMNDLQQLYLMGTAVSDQGLEHLAHLGHLRYLHLPGTNVTKQGIDRLHEALGNTSIYGTPNGESYSVGP